MTVPIRSMPEGRSTREAARLAEKRADPLYLAVEMASNAARMRAVRARRKAGGCCRECDHRVLRGFAYCRQHLAYERARPTK